MLSPAAQHRTGTRTTRAELPATAATVNPAREACHDSIIAAQFSADYHRMSHIKSRATRASAKRQALTQYQAWLNTFMVQQAYESKAAIMFVWLTVWHIDVGEWQRGLELARFALAERLSAPKDFSRTLAETVTEEIAGGILKAGDTATHADVLDDLAQVVSGYDMTDQITAKLHKARALARLDTDPEKARELLLIAAQLDPNSGVKRYLKTLDAGAKPTPSQAPEKIADYSLSARAAATLANMTAPAFLRHAKKHPELLPRLEIPVGTRHLYRFNPKHVKAYMKHHLVNARKDVNNGHDKARP
ncbi:phage terminase small subunit [Thiothrix winogradskyi]|uniref:Phage terminase small subunit n=1 Tax=Thiothrix winogradskyi TaxID=96472 RepID=A0ABY3SV49_9GAMM|nr:phage terminase small subunit [Thiothrix winogradskyi]UJS23372.1 phage terminase small subunit [Thiothrix winogradskyi]